MRDGTVSENDNKLYKELQSIVKDRERLYSRVKVTTALKLVMGEWKNVITQFELLSKDEPQLQELHLKYAEFQICRTQITIETFFKILDGIVNTGTLTFPNHHSIRMEGTMEKDSAFLYHYRPSNDQVFKLGWPANVFLFRPIDNCKTHPPMDVLISQIAPLFPDGWIAIKSTVGIDIEPNSDYWGTIQFLIPNFTAKLKRIKVGHKQMSISIATKLSPKQLVGKVYSEPSNRNQPDIEFTKLTVKTDISTTPDYLLIYLLDKKTGTVIDYRRYHRDWTDLPADVVVEEGRESIEWIIRNGETDKVEFKQEMPKDPEKLAVAAAAFASTHGGTIFVGVDDNGKIVGVKNPKIEDALQNIIRDRIPQPIDLKFSKHKIGRRTVIAMRIREGCDKPYVVKDRGVYIRANGTNRIATKGELDDMCADRNTSERAQVGTSRIGY